jgi:hypothetical protein
MTKNLEQETINSKSNELAQKLNEITNFVTTAAEKGVSVDVVERKLWSQVLAIGHQSMGMYFDLCGDGDMGATITLPDGRVLNRLPGLHPKPYQSVFGPLVKPRVVYGTREGQKIEKVPLDERLQFPESKFSYLLQDWDQSFAVKDAYAKVDETISRILNFSQSVDSLERMNNNMAQDVGAFWEALPVPPADEEGEIMVCSADGKGVVIRGDRPQTKQNRIDPEADNKPEGKKMSLVGAVYSIDRHERTPEAIVEALFRYNPKESGEESSPRPKPQHKHVRASLIRDEADTMQPSIDDIFGWMTQESQLRNPLKEKDTILLMDGQPSLWIAGKQYAGDENITEILDLIHAAAYVWDAAHIFHPKNSKDAETFTRERLLRILNGQVDSVVRGLRWMGSHQNLNKKKAKKLETVCRYFNNNAHRMRYDEYLEKGYPIASGVIEGACRYVVKDRMERTGMRWVLNGAHSMLQLRSVHASGLWDEFTPFRIAKERERLYPDADKSEKPERLIA